MRMPLPTTIAALLFLAIQAASTAVAFAQPHTPGSEAWLRRRRFDLRVAQEVEKTEKRAEKRKADFQAAERLTRSENETKEMAGRRIAKVNARLKMRSMCDAEFQKEAEAIALTIVDRLNDPDFDFVKWWRPVESKRLVGLAIGIWKAKLKNETETYAALVSKIAKLKETAGRKRKDDESLTTESEMRQLEVKAAESLKQLRYYEKRVKFFKGEETVQLFKVCIEFKPDGSDRDWPAVWTPLVWYFALPTETEAILLSSKEEREIAASEFESPDRRKK